MSYKDTLTIYEELVAGGCTESQAKIQAHQFGALGDHLGASLDGLREEFAEFRLDMQGIKKDMFWMRVIGGAMTATFLMNAGMGWFK